jgi:hypothetical protein
LFTVANVGFLPNNNPVKRKVCTKVSFSYYTTQQFFVDMLIPLEQALPFPSLDK